MTVEFRAPCPHCGQEAVWVESDREPRRTIACPCTEHPEEA